MGLGVRGRLVAVVAAVSIVAVGASLPAGAAPNAQAAAKSWSGSAAIKRLGDRLPQVAARHGWSTAKLQKMLASDRTLHVGPSDALFYMEPPLAADAPLPEATVTEQTDGTTDEFALHSRPGSNRVIYLDFDGHVISGTSAWGASVGGVDCYADPFDTDGSPGSFNTSERAVIRSVWERVAEDFAPFDVDVTTEDPGYAAINRTGSDDNQYGTRALITQSTTQCSNGKTLYKSVCSGGCGGIAYMAVFSSGTWHDYYQPALVFPAQLMNHDKYIAEATSHEVGHNLGLSHDGTSSVSYYTGHGNWASIMGVGYYYPLSQWSKGEYADANNKQDDIWMMQGYGLDLVPDDHADSAAGATVVEAPSFSEEGLIRSSDDLDVFAISVGNGAASFSVVPFENSPNLDAKLELRNSNYELVASNDPASGMINEDAATGVSASISKTLTAGRYYLVVDGVGKGDPAGSGYSDYGSLGRYTLSGTAAAPPDGDGGGGDGGDGGGPGGGDAGDDVTPPDPPTAVVAAPRDGAAQVTWTAPADQGTASVSDYTVKIAAPGGGVPQGVTGATTRSVGSASTSFTVTGLSNDVEYEITVAAVSGAGTSDTSDPATVTPDGTAPVATQTYPISAWELDTSVPVSWTASDSGAGVDKYDVSRQSTAYNASPGSWAAWKTGTRTTSGSYTGGFGTTNCFKTRATDYASNTSAYTSEKCTAIPLASGHLQYSKGWTKKSFKEAFNGTVRVTKQKGAVVQRSGIKAKRITLVVTKCKACGSLKVYWNGTYYKKISLVSSKTVRKQVVALVSFTKISKPGTLKLVVASSGKNVPIEGLGISKI